MIPLKSKPPINIAEAKETKLPAYAYTSRLWRL
jgi:hypothetical protein